MKNKRKQQSPTLAELLNPFLRNPPSPPPSTASHLLPPESPPTVSVNPRDCNRLRTIPDRQFDTAPRFYCVHPRDFRSLVQRLTGEIRGATPSDNNKPSMLEESKNNKPDAVGGGDASTESEKKGECSAYRGCFPSIGGFDELTSHNH